MSGPISGKLFWRRAKQLIAALPDADCILILRGGAVRGEPFRRSSALQAFLTGKEFANACFLISKKKFYALAGRHCAEQLLPITRGAPAGHTATLDDCVPQNDVNGDKIAQLVKEIQGFKKLALIECDLPHVRGEHFAERIIAEVRACGVATTCCAAATAAMLRIKDAVELDSVKKGGLFMSTLWNKVVLKELRERAEHARTEIDHADFAALVMVAIKDPALANVKGFPPDGTQGALTAPAMDTIVQSGKCSLTVQEKATSDGDELTIGTALLYTSVRFDQYCVCLGRTVMVDPSDEQRKAYQAALAARAAAIDCLRHGRRLSEARAAALNALPESLRGNLIEEIGWGTGMEWRDEGLLLSAACPATAAAGQCIVVHIGLQNLDNDGTPYAIQLADTVIVPPEGAEEAIVTTNMAKHQPDAVLWALDEDEEEHQDGEEQGAAPQMDRRQTTMEWDESNKLSKWHDQQLAILEENRRSWQQHGAAGDSDAQGRDHTYAGKLARGKIKPHRTGRVPQGNDMEIDENHNVVSLPISGHMVPFHVATIRNTTAKTDGDSYILTIDFHTVQEDYTPAKLFPKLPFIKQLVFRARETERLELESKRAQVRKMMQAMKKEEMASKDKDVIVPQGNLQLRPGGPFARLREVFIKPQVMKGKGMNRCIGDLEAHQNGLRFASKLLGGKNIDVLYNNIKHFMCIPSKHDRFAVIHCVLHNDIRLLTDKKTSHIQWWVETETDGDDIDGRQRDDDSEDEEEERAKQTKMKINKEFIQFGKLVRQGTGMQTEVPFNEAWFEGYAASSDAGLEMLACTKQTISHVVNSSKFFVITMSDVEVVVFERVAMGRANFDVAFINKDYSKPAQLISSIPQKYMSILKDLCCQVYKLKFYETPQNNNWREVLKEVQSSQKKGCWNPWAEYKPDKENEGSSEEEEDEILGWEHIFNNDAGEDSTSDEEAEESSEDDEDSDDEEGEESLEDESDEPEGEDEEEEDDSSALDWSEHERQAEKADRKRSWSEDEDEPRKARAKPAAKRRR
eukprot:TRINITY_DN951_c1_g1_i2.p1 TRINITY_DN951_c1_g1~~TRINITY_DN951_c1_g1_i2.p1  ORF type:complete len:1027 (+),score=449.94 TRINITY_DN951_c1_g1_i2:85-3165(+)